MAAWQEATRIMAKDLVRTRRYIKKMIMMKTQIQAVALKIQVRRGRQIELNSAHHVM